MKILMTQTVHGSLDGTTVTELLSGVEYETADTPRGQRLAAYHVRQGVAVLVPDSQPVTLERVKRTAKAK